MCAVYHTAVSCVVFNRAVFCVVFNRAVDFVMFRRAVFCTLNLHSTTDQNKTGTGVYQEATAPCQCPCLEGTLLGGDGHGKQDEHFASQSV